MNKDFETWARKEKFSLEMFKEKKTGNLRYYSVLTEGAWRGWEGAMKKKEKNKDA